MTQGIQTVEVSNGSLPAVPEGSNTLVQSLNAAGLALESATNDFERIQIRDTAKAVEAASAILKRKDIQIQAANLVQGAERAIAKANPPNHGGKGTENKSCEISNPTTLEEPIPSGTIRDIRKAHDKITDEEFEEAKQEAIENQEPLTRSYLKEKSQEKKQAEKEIEPVTDIPILDLTSPDGQRAGMTQASGNEEWYTPSEYMDSVRELFGGSIDLDPASCDVANEIVKAERYFTKEQDGLQQDWEGSVYLNPPYTRAVVAEFTDKLIHHYQRGDVSQAILLVYATTDTDWFQKALSASDAVLFTNSRIKFYNVSGTQPGHYGQALFYFGKKAEEFNRLFSDKGAIVWRYNSQMTAK